MFGYIYKITNRINGKIYIGQTTKSIEYRFEQHKRTAKRKLSFTSYLYRAMNECGLDNFDVEELQTCDTREELDKAEQHWITHFCSQNSDIGYNILEGGRGGGCRSKEFQLSEAQLSALESGRHLPSSEKQKNQLAERRRNCVVSEETRKKLSIASSGHVASEETKKKMSAAHKGKKKKPLTEAQKQNCRNASLGRIHIHKGTENKNPTKEEALILLSEGWERGYYKQ